MRTVDYIDVFNGTAHVCELALDEEGGQLATGRDFAVLRGIHSRRLRKAWEHAVWPELVVDEERWFRGKYAAGTAYPAPTLTVASEVFFTGSQMYYQALRAATGVAPATYAGGVWTTRLDYWAECASSYAAEDYEGTKDYAQGDQARYAENGRYYQLYAASSTGNLPTDATRWGVLTAFDRYIAYAQPGFAAWDHCFGVWNKDRNNFASAVKHVTRLSGKGAQVLNAARSGWLGFRRRCPRLFGNVFAATAVYAAGAQVYFASAALRGNFYDCVTGTSAGESPATAAAKWALVEVPLMFEEYLTHGGAADFLRPDSERVADADREEILAEIELGRLMVLWFGQVGQPMEMSVLTR